jgi:hypothetical protein
MTFPQKVIHLMTLDFSEMMAALGEQEGSTDPPPAEPDDHPNSAPIQYFRPVLNAAELLADVQQHKRRLEMIAKTKLKKDKKVEKSKGYLDKIGAREKFQKAQLKKGPGGKGKSGK